MRWKFKEASREIDVVLEKIEDGVYQFSVDGNSVRIENPRIFPWSLECSLGKLAIESWNSSEWRVASDQGAWILKPESLEQGSKTGGNLIKSQMPGKILKILVREGEELKPGQSLIIIEAMKMENEIRCDSAAKVKRICVNQGQSVEAGVLLLELE